MSRASTLEAALAVVPPEAGLGGAKIRALLHGYHARWSDSGYRPVQVEKVLHSPLWNPATGRRSRKLRIAGKVDLLAELDGALVLVDHKATSEDISDPASPYWRQLIVEGQLSHYLLLLWLNGVKADYAVWDVVRKPAISPRQLTKGERSSLSSTRCWFSQEFPSDEIDKALQTGRETDALYQARLRHDCTVERPQWYFQRRTIPRLDAEIHEYATELWDHGQEIVQIRRTGRHVRNSGACLIYGGPCKFLGICSGHDEPDSANWQRSAWVHPELPPLEGDGRGILTNSRIRTFQTCRRKHYLQYELGIERLEEEEREALVFGSLWHDTMEAYFNAMRGEANGNCTTADSVSEVECGAVARS
jgi:hypothetical protein